jgi:hypothetical protein
MSKLGMAFMASLVAVSAFSCTKKDDETQRKLDYLISKVDGLEKKVASGGGGMQPAMQQPQRPRGPDPAAVYAIDVSGAAVEGPAQAKVTIVEAFDFA